MIAALGRPAGRRTALLALPLAALAALAACESDASGPSNGQRTGVVQLDASSNSSFAYLRFEGDNAVVVNTPGPNDWDLGFRRFSVRLNGGVAGPKGVVGFNLANNAGASTAEFLAMTPENQLAAFEAVGAADIPPEGQFTSEGLGPDFSSWFRFDPTTNGLVANPQAAWKVKRANGAGYALFRVSRIVASQTTLDSVTFEWRLEDQSGTLGAAQTATVGTNGGTIGLDLGTGTEVAATGCGWDLSADAEFVVSVNAACGAGTFPLDVNQTFAAMTTANDAPAYGPFLALLTGPIPSSFSDPKGPFLYSLNDDQRLTPTFNIYLIKVGDAVYKVQLIDYYGSGGESGHPTVRYARIQ
jgi:hypothetical protein